MAFCGRGSVSKPFVGNFPSLSSSPYLCPTCPCWQSHEEADPDLADTHHQGRGHHRQCVGYGELVAGVRLVQLQLVVADGAEGLGQLAQLHDVDGVVEGQLAQLRDVDGVVEGQLAQPHDVDEVVLG